MPDITIKLLHSERPPCCKAISRPESLERIKAQFELQLRRSSFKGTAILKKKIADFEEIIWERSLPEVSSRLWPTIKNKS